MTDAEITPLVDELQTGVLVDKRGDTSPDLTNKLLRDAAAALTPPARDKGEG